MSTPRTTLRRKARQSTRTAIIVAVTTAVVAPVAAFATNSFTDVPTSAFYHSAVDWAKTKGVTAGCNPPDNTRFCPEDTVTRGQMAVFLNRLDTKNVFVTPSEMDAAITTGTTGPVDADTLDDLDSSAFLRTNGTAANANKLDDLDSSAFLRTNGTAANADKLDGDDATAFRTIVARVTESTDVAIDGGCDSHSSVTIDVPVAGKIIVEADVNLIHDHVNNGQPSGAFLLLDTSDTGCTAETRPDFHRTAAIVDASEPAGTKFEQAHVSRQFDVTAGTHTFYLNATAPLGSAATRFDSSALQAIFYPG